MPCSTVVDSVSHSHRLRGSRVVFMKWRERARGAAPYTRGLEKQYADLTPRSSLKVSFAPGLFVLAERGLNVCFAQDGVCPPAGRTLPANNRVTSWKPLTAAGELVSAEGVRRRLRERQRSAFTRRCFPACVPCLRLVLVALERNGQISVGCRVIWR